MAHPQTTPQQNRHAQATNGFPGFAILPRYATEVYYNCSTVAQEEALYNAIYPPATYFQGKRSTINDIMQREATRVVRDSILGLRKDPHM